MFPRSSQQTHGNDVHSAEGRLHEKGHCPKATNEAHWESWIVVGCVCVSFIVLAHLLELRTVRLQATDTQDFDEEQH